MKRFLITGATGFVGANLVRELLNSYDVEIYITARRNSDFWRLSDIIKKLRIFYIDLYDRTAVFNLIKQMKPNIICHVAAYGGFPNQTDKELIIRTNLYGTINLLDAAIENHVEQFINTGSSSEYGIKDRPMNENDVCEPLNFYGVTKLAATNYCAMVGKNNNYRVCTLRLFSPYGKYEDPSRLYPSIVNALEKGLAPRLSRPDSVRDFIPIEKVTAIYLQILDSNYKPGDIINVGSGKQMSIREFHYLIAKMFNVNIEPIWGTAPEREFEPKIWQADINKLNGLLVEKY